MLCLTLDPEGRGWANANATGAGLLAGRVSERADRRLGAGTRQDSSCASSLRGPQRRAAGAVRPMRGNGKPDCFESLQPVLRCRRGRIKRFRCSPAVPPAPSRFAYAKT